MPTWTEDGLHILIRRSKSDQAGAGRKLGIPYGSDPKNLPGACVPQWIVTAVISVGPVFRGFRNLKMMDNAITPQVVALVVKKAAERAGLDATKLSGHSLRSGLATTAVRRSAAS